ncbi:MAG: hypothetical protein DRP62_07685 [Planctomycetota bacterium]|nr:MAG: hypothetical protein DRP62_07685 [Planctomycetota bacterium]
MQIPIEVYQDRLTGLYAQRYNLNRQTSVALRQREEGIYNQDSYGHDAFCWNQRNLRKVATKIAFLEEAIPRLRLGLSIDDLAEQLTSQMETFDADDYRRLAVYKPKEVIINQKIRTKNIINFVTFCP